MRIDPTGLASLRSQRKLRAVPSVLDWDGVDIKGANDNLSVFQRAINESGGLLSIPPNSQIVIDGGLAVPSFFHLVGLGGINESELNQRRGAPKFVFTGTASACFYNANAAQPLLYTAFRDFSIRCTGDYDWIFDLTQAIEFNASDIRMQALDTACGGIRSRKINPSDVSWVNSLHHVQVRLPDNSSARTLDLDWGDSIIAKGTFTGGQGAALRGTGGVRVESNLFDRTKVSGAATLTIFKETATALTHSLVNNQFDEFTTGLQFEGKAGDGLTDVRMLTIVAGNTFRSGLLGSTDVRFVNNSGRVFDLPRIGHNTYSGHSRRFAIDAAANWKGLPHVEETLFGRYTAFAVHTGTTARTQIARVVMPGALLGPYGRLRVRGGWTFTGANGNRTHYVELGGVTFQAVAVSSGNLSAVFETEIHNRGSVSAQIGSALGLAFSGNFGGNFVTSNLNTDADQNLDIEMQLASADDTAVLEWFEVTVWPG